MVQSAAGGALTPSAADTTHKDAADDREQQRPAKIDGEVRYAGQPGGVEARRPSGQVGQARFHGDNHAE